MQAAAAPSRQLMLLRHITSLSHGHIPQGLFLQLQTLAWQEPVLLLMQATRAGSQTAGFRGHQPHALRTLAVFQSSHAAAAPYRGAVGEAGGACAARPQQVTARVHLQLQTPLIEAELNLNEVGSGGERGGRGEGEKARVGKEERERTTERWREIASESASE